MSKVMFIYINSYRREQRKVIVAEYDTSAQCWYDEAFENPIDIIRWKKI